MNDHPAIGPTDEALPALTSRGEHDLAGGGATGESAEGKGEHGPEASGPDRNGEGSDEHRGHRRPEKACAEQFGARLAPWQDRCHSHHEQRGDGDGAAEGIEVRSPDREPGSVERLGQKWKDRAEQHDEGHGTEQHVVGQETRFTTQRRIDGTWRAQPIPPPPDQQTPIRR